MNPAGTKCIWQLNLLALPSNCVTVSCLFVCLFNELPLALEFFYFEHDRKAL